MGFPMPTAMTTLARLGKEHMFLWAWGINGCFSVIGAAAVPLVATTFGLAAVLASQAAPISWRSGLLRRHCGRSAAPAGVTFARSRCEKLRYFGKEYGLRQEGARMPSPSLRAKPGRMLRIRLGSNPKVVTRAALDRAVCF